MSDARQYALPTQMVGPGQVSIRLRPIPSSKPQAAAAAAASSASAFRPSPAATALLNAGRSAENAVASLSSPPPHIPNIEMLTAGILDPLSVVNSAANPVVSATRFRPVPREDVMICHSDKVRTPILPQEFPGFIPSNAPTKLKLLGILEPEGLGKADKTSSHDIILYRWVNDEIRRLESDEGSQAAANGAVDRDSSGVKQQFLELKPIPAHKDVYPISVSLHIKPNEQAQLISRLHADGHRNSVWPNVIQYYQPFKLYRNNAFAHYEVKVLQSSLDRYFPVGLFGTCANGLSLVLLALAKVPKSAKSQKKTADGSSSSSSAAAAAAASADDDESSGPDKIKGILYHYITLICLQYWTLVHERWMELNPIAKDVTQYLPEYMFIFHHTTDWTQSFKDTKRDRKGEEKQKKKSKKSKAKSTDKTVQPPQQEDPLEEITDNDSLREAAVAIAFVPFLEAVFDYVIDRMDELEDSQEEKDSAIAAACKKLSLSRSAVRKRSANISTNHTQYFTCSRMKMHIVKELVQTINDGVHSNTAGQSLGFLETKWFAKNKNQLKMHIPKAANEAATAGVNRYNNPYFWSHLTFLPTQGIVVQEATLRCGESPEANPMHQACALRRLLFVAHNSESATIMSSLLRVGVCTFEFSHTPERVTLSSKEFIEQFVQTKKFKSMAMLHEARVEQQMYLPAVAKPAALRYCVHFDDEIGRAYIPSLSRDLASFPVSDEQDILSMSRSYFLACSTSTNIVSNEAVLLQTGVLKNNPASLCTRFANSRLTHKAFPVLKDLGGLSHGFTKLCPDNPLCNLVYIDGALKLTEAERRQLRLIAKSDGVFSGLHMWKLLLKITSSDSEAVSSYLFHAHQSEQRRIKSERVKMEEGVDGPVVPAAVPAAAAAASLSEYDRDWVLDRLADLQSEWERASQVSVRQFRRVWGATVPAPPSNKRKSHSEQDSDHDFVPNPYWPAQECFLAQLMENWNYCDRPIVTANALSKLIGELMAVDLEKFTITLFAANATDGGVRLDREKLKMLLSGAVISQLGRTGPTPIHSLVSIAEDSGVALTEHEIVFHGDERSVLGKKFAQFFLTSRYATSSCNIEVAFFMWYYFTAVIRPFVDNLPRLFPISSVIKHQPVSTMLPPKTWLQALVPSDSTPHLTSLMFKFSADLCKSDIHRELETSIDRGTKMSTQAQAMLRAMQTVIEAHDDPSRKKDSKLNIVNSFAAELLGSLKPPASASAASSRQPFAALARPAAAAGVTRMQALQDQAFHVIIQQLKVFPIIPPITVTKLYEDLSALIDIDQDPIDFIVSIFCKVQGALLVTPLLQPLSKKFTESLLAWQKDNSSSQLLRTCALKFNKIVDRR